MRYTAYFAAYMLSVEFFVYWQHRLLHDIKPGYRRDPCLLSPLPPAAALKAAGWRSAGASGPQAGTAEPGRRAE